MKTPAPIKANTPRATATGKIFIADLGRWPVDTSDGMKAKPTSTLAAKVGYEGYVNAKEEQNAVDVRPARHGYWVRVEHVQDHSAISE